MSTIEVSDGIPKREATGFSVKFQPKIVREFPVSFYSELPMNCKKTNCVPIEKTFKMQINNVLTALSPLLFINFISSVGLFNWRTALLARWKASGWQFWVHPQPWL